MINPQIALQLEIVSGLIAIGYLSPADVTNHIKVRRAVKRFQRHAARPYRMPRPDAPVSFLQKATGECDQATVAEIRRWVERKWRIPVGRFSISSLQLGGGAPVRLREDAAAAWSELVALADSKGATLRGTYGDSARTPYWQAGIEPVQLSLLCEGGRHITRFHPEC